MNFHVTRIFVPKLKLQQIFYSSFIFPKYRAFIKVENVKTELVNVWLLFPALFSE